MGRRIQQWLGSRHVRPDGSEASIPTRFASLETGVERSLARDLRGVVGESAGVLLVFDARTRVFVDRVERALVEQGLTTHEFLVPDESDGSSPANEQTTGQRIARRMEELGVASAVAVGSGTLNDLTKFASHALSRPYMVYGTAASMNGYNSPICALYVDGLKSSVPSTPALGMYADPEVIAAAPREMNLAGLGDLCSKPFAGADAAIANLLAGEAPWRLPTDMVQDVFEEVLEQAEAIGRADAEALALLMEALWISGFSMTLAGTSAPASGGEHLWSHRIDMAQHDAGQPHKGLHGTQVGIACGLVRPLFARAADCSHADVKARLQAPVQAPGADESAALASWLEARHPDLSERSRAALLAEAQRKYEPAARQERRRSLEAQWPAIQRELFAAHAHANRVEEALLRAGAPRDPRSLDVSLHEARRILRVCRDIRNRFTILDLTVEVLGEEALVADFPRFLPTEN